MYYQRPYNILIADDHQLIIDGLTGILKEQELIGSIQSACNGQEAIEKLKNSNIDCVLMDINMPVMNGIEATKIIKKQLPGIKVVIVSVTSDPTLILALLDIGADGFVIKEISIRNLLEAIDRVMQNEKYVSEELDLILSKYSALQNANLGTTAGLTTREVTILTYLGEGASKKQIAEKLFLNPDTIETHLKNIIAKTGTKNMTALIRYAAENKFS